MHRYRPTRRQAEYLDAVMEGAAAQPWSPDGLTFDDLLPLKTPGNAQIERGTPQPTTWLLSGDEERAAIRRRLRPASDVHLLDHTTETGHADVA